MRIDTRNLVVVLVVILIIVLASYILLDFRQYPPTRPSGVDPLAQWAGGADGGFWVACEDIDVKRELFRCRIYHEQGHVFDDSEYALSRDGKTKSITYSSSNQGSTNAEHLRSIGFSSFNGQRIRLANGNFLLRVLSSDLLD